LPGCTPAPSQIFDSMSFGVAALAESWGARAAASGPLADDARAFSNAIHAAISDHDIVVVIGGASAGDHDHARPALRALGGEFLFEKVSLRPGKPTWFARLGEKSVLGLPGNPGSAFVCARLFLRPLLDRLCGRDPSHSMRTTPARARRPLDANGPRETYLRARSETDNAGQNWADAASNQDSSLLSVIAQANILVVRAPNAPATKEGDLVETLNF
jgi:molybdopterin molybdotransferase